MLPTWVLEQMGISDPQIGMEIVLSYQIGDSYDYVTDTFLCRATIRTTFQCAQIIVVMFMFHPLLRIA